HQQQLPVAAHSGSGGRRHFFFQAEDGIRDGHVTGVQTCALPISPTARTSEAASASGRTRARHDARLKPRATYVAWSVARDFSPEIGRASCRERVEILVGAVAVER